MGQFAYLEGDFLAIAHRGGALEAERQGFVENTFPAFEYVTHEVGYTHVETDVRADEAGNLYVWHGKGTERLDKKNPLKERDVESIRDQYGPDAAPLLVDILDGFPDTKFAIDPKHAPAIDPLALALKRTGAVGRVSITAFSQKRTDAAGRRIAEETGQEVCTGMAIAHTAELLGHLSVPNHAWLAPNPVAQLPRSLVTKRLIRAAHAGDIKVHVWVVNSEEEMKAFLDKGVDGIMTDEPSLLLDVVRKRRIPT